MDNRPRNGHRWIKDLSGEEAVEGTYLVKEKRTGTSRRGESYLMLTLADRTGEVEARVWEKAEALSPLFNRGDVIRIQGQTAVFKGQVQITISSLIKALPEEDPSIFVESSPFSVAEMMASLREALKNMSHGQLRSLIDRFMGDGEFMGRFKKAPAAKNFHHCYLGGLLEHTLAVCRLALAVSGQYKDIDGNLLLAGAFLHDIGKVRELSWGLEIDYTDEGRLVGHVVLGAAMFDEKVKEIKGFPPELAVKLKHMILSHHGEYLFGSPKRPKFPEAFALHFIDDLDAKLNALDRIAERDREEGPWTQYNRLLERYILKGEIRIPTQEGAEGERTAPRQAELF
jgi:3'-5' exoribonuclease